MVIAVVIPADSTAPIQQIEYSTVLEDLQRAVGGFIEAIHLPEAVMFANEEGKLERLPLNDRATRLCRALGRMTTADFIVGNTIVFGYNGDTDTYRNCPEMIGDFFRLPPVSKTV